MALGGVGEIGRNMTVVDTAEGMIVVDCGLLFPSNDVPGVDFILPDLRPIEHRVGDIHALVLTHGHEDHIGGVPFFVEMAPQVPIYGTKFTLALVASKLQERGLTADLREVVAGDAIEAGAFACQFFSVTHSVPDGVAVAIRVNGRTIFHTGDFKLDQRPLDGRLTDVAGFGRIGSEGVDLLLSDSTNADVPGHLPDEVDVAPNFLHIFEDAPGVVLVACFASHVHRVQQVIDQAAAAGKQVAFFGRSMERNMRIAQATGLLTVPPGLLVAHSDIGSVDRRNLVIACTGSQGEPMAVLSRLARGQHRLEVESGDIVVLSARLIPGNETDVFRVINALSERGVTVLHGGNANIHASGHAAAGELRQVLNLIQPRHLMPVHGEWRHMRAHADLAKSVGMTDEQIVLAPNGTMVELTDAGAATVGTIEIEPVMIDTTSHGNVDDELLRDRQVMGYAGILLVSVLVEDASWTLREQPRLEFRGLRRDDAFSEDLLDVIERAVEDTANGDGDQRTAEALETFIGRRIVRWLRSSRRRVPAINVSVTTVG